MAIPRFKSMTTASNIGSDLTLTLPEVDTGDVVIIAVASTKSSYYSGVRPTTDLSETFSTTADHKLIFGGWSYANGRDFSGSGLVDSESSDLSFPGSLGINLTIPSVNIRNDLPIENGGFLIAHVSVETTTFSTPPATAAAFTAPLGWTLIATNTTSTSSTPDNFGDYQSMTVSHAIFYKFVGGDQNTTVHFPISIPGDPTFTNGVSDGYGALIYLDQVGGVDSFTTRATIDANDLSLPPPQLTPTRPGCMVFTFMDHAIYNPIDPTLAPNFINLGANYLVSGENRGDAGLVPTHSDSFEQATTEIAPTPSRAVTLWGAPISTVVAFYPKSLPRVEVDAVVFLAEGSEGGHTVTWSAPSDSMKVAAAIVYTDTSGIDFTSSFEAGQFGTNNGVWTPVPSTSIISVSYHPTVIRSIASSVFVRPFLEPPEKILRVDAYATISTIPERSRVSSNMTSVTDRGGVIVTNSHGWSMALTIVDGEGNPRVIGNDATYMTTTGTTTSPATWSAMAFAVLPASHGDQRVFQDNPRVVSTKNSHLRVAKT